MQATRPLGGNCYSDEMLSFVTSGKGYSPHLHPARKFQNSGFKEGYASSMRWLGLELPGVPLPGDLVAHSPRVIGIPRGSFRKVRYFIPVMKKKIHINLSKCHP